jgi:hypothetical protein
MKKNKRTPEEEAAYDFLYKRIYDYYRPSFNTTSDDDFVQIMNRWFVMEETTPVILKAMVDFKKENL